ncbi:hypothetical protein HYPSUDRAFT_163863 [Hypholoma sublateritium FD-334 SS-4]|uniref:Uncharacterized protein n=1 Tax=Hypholoma sublateritium (strain FD-334 SS-4) TaxID=945553 RepID=A0A0D2P2E3_HYPSF|nr:hypothetical protein HYPSUDRAFT_163863 [Hypholoma sublateritium FD-334 SS-4]
MCRDEVFGDWYRPCGHFVKSYYSGNRIDCRSQYCAASSAHIHKAANCGCTKNLTDERRIQSMFHQLCGGCKGEYVVNVRRGDD